MIIVSRRYGKINGSQLKKMGVVLKKAQYFITCNELPLQTVQELRPERVRQLLSNTRQTGRSPSAKDYLRIKPKSR